MKKNSDLKNINGENNLKKYNVAGIVFGNQFRRQSSFRDVKMILR